MKIVVFAGGVGTRLWPLSRKNTPKQFGKVTGEASTLQLTVEHLLPSFPASDIYIATGKSYRNIVMEQLPTIPEENFIFEPTMRDVGPAIGLVSFLLEKKFPDEPIAILWSDHIVREEVKFRNILLQAEKKVSEKQADFIFIAQNARFANQNCGWIALGEPAGTIEGGDVYHFKQLIYRPELAEAEAFFASGKHVWNLGYFVTTPRFLTGLYKQYAPGMQERLLQIQNVWGTANFEQTLDEVYPTLEKISFDDAILVKLNPENFYVISAELGWSDVGTWDSLKEALSKVKEENVTNGKVMLENTNDTLVFNYNKTQLIVGIDLDEIIIINTDDVLLICPKKSVPKIKKFVADLEGTENEHLT